MGAAQSSPCAQFGASASTEDDKRLRPYGMAANSNYLQLNSSHCTLYSGMVSLAQENKYADLLIICGDDRYYVHRAIVCPRSAFFNYECSCLWYDDDSLVCGPKTIWIDLSDCESNILAAVLAFLYTLDYNAFGKQAVTFPGPEKGTKSDHAASTSTNMTGTSTPKNGPREAGPAHRSASPSTVSSEIIPTPSHSGTRHASTEREPEKVPDKDTPNELVFHLQVLAAAHLFEIKALYDVAQQKFAARIRVAHGTPEMIGCIRHLYDRSTSTNLGEAKELATQYAVRSFNKLKMLDGWDDLIIECPDFCAEMFKRARPGWFR